MIIYKLDRKHHFYTQYKSHLLGWKLQPLRNLSKQLYKNINIFIFTGCQSFIPWQLMREKALQIIESMVADNKKYILWFKYCLISLVECLLWLYLTSCAGNEWNLQAPGGWSALENSQPHNFLFWPLSLVSGGNAFHFSCLLSDLICERGRAPSMPTSKIYIPGLNPWSCEMVFSVPKDSKGELSDFSFNISG